MSYTCEVALADFFDGLVMGVEVEQIELAVEKVAQFLEVIFVRALQLAAVGAAQKLHAVQLIEHLILRGMVQPF